MIASEVAKLHYKAHILKTIGLLSPSFYCLFHSRKNVVFNNFNNASWFDLTHSAEDVYLNIALVVCFYSLSTGLTNIVLKNKVWFFLLNILIYFYIWILEL